MCPSPLTQTYCPNPPNSAFEEPGRFLLYGIYDTPQSLLKSMPVSPLTSHGFNGNLDFKNLTGLKLQSLPGFLQVALILLPI